MVDQHWRVAADHYGSESGQTVNTIMRLAPGVSPQSAAAEPAALNQRLAERDPNHFPKTPYRTPC